MSAPRLIVVPAWVNWMETIMFLVFVAICAALVSSERSRANEARAEAETLRRSLDRCGEHVTVCLGSVSQIASELELSGVEF